MNTIYCHRDQFGYPLYVGCTSNLSARTSQHKSKAPWWPLVDTVEVLDTIEDPREASHVEAEYIRDLDARYNVVRSPSLNIGKKPVTHGTQRLADLLLGRPVIDWATERRTAGKSWRQISLELRDLHNLDVTYETLRSWCLAETTEVAP